MIEIDTSFTAGIISYVGEIWEDFSPLILIFVGLMVGMWIIEKIFEIIENRLEEKEKQVKFQEEIESEVEREVFTPYKKHLRETAREEYKKRLFKEA